MLLKRPTMHRATFPNVNSAEVEETLLCIKITAPSARKLVLNNLHNLAI